MRTFSIPRSVLREKNKKEMEYEDAPSGFVTLYNYKEPFMPFKSGYGFEGVLLMDGESSRVQCHLCGNWFDYLQHHLKREHGMTTGQFKEIVGLRPSTALIGEKFREKLCHAGLEKRKANLRPGKKKTKEEIAKTTETLKKIGKLREQQNTVGTCPEQLLDRLRKLKEELGHQPSSKECTFTQTVVKVFGSYREAMRRAGMISRKPGGVLRASDEEILKEIARFRDTHDRWPSGSDNRRGILMYSIPLISKRFNGFRHAQELAKLYLKS